MTNPESAAGAISHLKELAWLEKLFYTNLQLDELQRRIIQSLPNINTDNPSWSDLHAIDRIVKEFYGERFDVLSGTVVRAFVLGTLISSAEDRLTHPVIDFNALPTNVRQAAINRHLTARETKALDYAVSRTAKNLTRASNSTVEIVQDKIFQNIGNRGTPKEVAKQLQATFADDDSEYNRDWNLVAINETNSAFNNAILSMNIGSWMMWKALPGACEYCAKQNGKLFFVIDPERSLSYEFLKPGSTEYDEKAWLWENTVWTGKDNIGRSRHARKRIEDGTRERKHHELYMPAIPAHVRCRCRWLKVNVEILYVENGSLKFKSEDPAAWKKWHDKYIKPRENDITRFQPLIRRVI